MTGTTINLYELREAVDAYAALARQRGLTLPQLALGYVRSRWFIGSTLIGATTMAQLEEDIAAAQFELDAETLAGIAQIQARYDAKKAKNFAEADRIRDELKSQGVEITDIPGGVKWKHI